MINKNRMLRTAMFLLAASCLVLSASVASAQYYGGWGNGYGPGYGNGNNYYLPQANTVAQSYAYGLSDVTRARSQANLTNAEALNSLSQTRSQEIQNSVSYTNAFFDKRRINEQYQESHRRPRATNEDLIRYARDGMPDRASGTQIDSITGEISWPIVLQAPEFDSYRAALDDLFQHRAVTGSVMSRQPYLKTRETCDAFLAALLADIKNLVPNDYIEGKKFIEMLKYEAQQSPS